MCQEESGWVGTPRENPMHPKCRFSISGIDRFFSPEELRAFARTLPYSM